MQNAFNSNIDDTIVALSTAEGEGAIALIRMSGSNAIPIVAQYFKGSNLHQVKPNSLHFGHFIVGDDLLDEVVISVFKSPKSYTGEDIIEISCHGSSYIIQEIIKACLDGGARLAQPGEFTQRAFMNGKMDLAQAEAVADLIASESKTAHHLAMHHMRGGFSKDLLTLKDQLIEFTALLELELDFSEEDVEFADRKQFLALIQKMKLHTTELLRSFQLGNAIKKGISVAIIGEPNVGKSTLLNAMLNEERAIVSDIAGTTRDTIEETLNIQGVLFRLIDTAGIRDHSADQIENIGIERSKTNAAQADIILLLEDLTQLTFEQPKAIFETFPWIEPYSHKILRVGTKFNIWKNSNQSPDTNPTDSDIVYTDGKDQYGIESLKSAIYRKTIGGQIHVDHTIITNVRHRDILQKINDNLVQIELGLHTNLSGDLLAIDIHQCLHLIGELTGRIDFDKDVLGAIFGRFCIGK